MPIVKYDAMPVDVTDPALLIRINKLFEYGMSENALYEATRGIWVIGPRRHKARYAMAVYAGVVQEVYEISTWHRAGDTIYETRDQDELASKKDRRWEFLGQVAPDAVRERYIFRSVAHYFQRGQQNPVFGVCL